MCLCLVCAHVLLLWNLTLADTSTSSVWTVAVMAIIMALV
jgi:hypothetical protein